MSDLVVRFPLRVDAAGGAPSGSADVEEFARALDEALADPDVIRIERAPGDAAPEGARGVELIAALDFIITAVEAGQSLAKVVEAIRRVAAQFRARGKAVTVTVGPSEVDLATARPEQVVSVVGELLALPSQERSGGRYALVVANANYDDATLSQLRSPGRDAEELVRVLGDPSIGGFTAEALLDGDERTIRRRLAAFFANRDRDDVLLVHFSCHGIKDERGRLHLAARDTDLALLGATAIPAGFVNDLLSATQSQRVVLMLDCCYSGAFARGTTSRADDGVQIADEFGGGNGRIVLTASSATEYAFEDGELTRSEARPSAFTGAIVDGLAHGTADLDGDGEISVDELYDYTYRTVRARTPGQAPRKWVFGLEGNLVVARSVRPARLPDSIAEDLASERVVLRMEGVRELTALLAAGKSGLRATAIRELTRVRDDDDSARVRQAAVEALTAYTGAAAVPVADQPPARTKDSAAVSGRPTPVPAGPAPVMSPALPAREIKPVPAKPAVVAVPPASRLAADVEDVAARPVKSEARARAQRTESGPSGSEPPSTAAAPTATTTAPPTPVRDTNRPARATARVPAQVPASTSGSAPLGPAGSSTLGAGGGRSRYRALVMTVAAVLGLIDTVMYTIGLARPGFLHLPMYALTDITLFIGGLTSVLLLVRRNLIWAAYGVGYLCFEVCYTMYDSFSSGGLQDDSLGHSKAAHLILASDILALFIFLLLAALVATGARAWTWSEPRQWVPRLASGLIVLVVSAYTLIKLAFYIGCRRNDALTSFGLLSTLGAIVLTVAVVFAARNTLIPMAVGWVIGGVAAVVTGHHILQGMGDADFSNSVYGWIALVAIVIVALDLIERRPWTRFAPPAEPSPSRSE